MVSPPHEALHRIFREDPITTVKAAMEDVFLTVLTALVHGRSRKVGAILDALAQALDTIDTETATFLAQFTEVGLGKTLGRKHWRSLMAFKTYGFEEKLAKIYREEGREEGSHDTGVQYVLRILQNRGLPIPEEIRQRIKAVDDLDELTRLHDRAMNVTSAEELFG